MDKKLYKIAVVGPESTGKTTVSEQLADYYKATWVQEYSREYCSKLTRECTLEDEIKMFYGQLAMEAQKIPKARELLFCDVTILTVKIWSEHVLNYCPRFIIEKVYKHHYDFYLLMDIDLPWKEDPLRNFSTKRKYFLQVYQKELSMLKAKYKLISGLGNKRLENAIIQVDNFLKS